MKKSKEQGTPLSQWYKRYKVMREREIMMEISNKEHVITTASLTSPVKSGSQSQSACFY